MKEVNIKTVNQTPNDFYYLFALADRLRSLDDDVVFDFANCRFLRQNAVAFLGGLAYMVSQAGHNAQFRWESLSSDVKRNLARNGFISHFGGGAKAPRGNAISFRHDESTADLQELVEYLSKDWLGSGWVNISEALSNAIVGKVLETYANGFEHSDSPVGVLSCGQHYPKLKTLWLSVVDFGIGIPENVRRHFDRTDIRADKALKWAFKPGTTTKENGTSRGMGLDLLKSFIKVNNGFLDLYSNDGRVTLTSSSEKYMRLGVSFQGTIVNIMIVCDERYYFLASEEPPSRLF